MTRLYYTVKTTLRFYPEIVRVGRLHPKELSRFIIMLILCNCILLVLLFLDPLKTLIVFIVPMLLILLLHVEVTYDHHAGLPTDNALEASNNNVSKTYNLLSWNLGFHTAHHLRPGLHWSKLPHFHNTIADQIPSINVFDHLPFKSYFQKPESSHNPPSDIWYHIRQNLKLNMLFEIKLVRALLTEPLFIFIVINCPYTFMAYFIFKRV